MPKRPDAVPMSRLPCAFFGFIPNLILFHIVALALDISQTTEKDIEDLFVEYGKVKEVRIAGKLHSSSNHDIVRGSNCFLKLNEVDRGTGRSKGWFICLFRLEMCVGLTTLI